MSILDFIVLGVIAGVSPGPITSLMLGETLKNGWESGVRIPAALILSNLVIAPLSIVLLYHGAEVEGLLNVVSCVGAIFLIYLGFMEWNSNGSLKLTRSTHPIRTAFLADMVNPFPYVFWLTVLAPPLVLRSKTEGLLVAVMLWSIFVLGLVVTKLLIIFLAHRIKKHLNQRAIGVITKILALTLFAYGLKLLIHFL